MDLSHMRFAVIGAGRMGTALSHALREAGLSVSGPLGRGADGAYADAVILCVPDRAIAEAAAIIKPGRLVGHTSGATSLAAIGGHEAFSLHPLISVAAGEDVNFIGVPGAVAGTTERALDLATSLAQQLGMLPFQVPDDKRDLYHAAASVASNYLVTLASVAERLFSLAVPGADRSLLTPLVWASTDNWVRMGARALTGPIARGDNETVDRQRSAVAHHASDLLPLWDALRNATAALAEHTKA
jgi:predicted short-subunit dehydrogenase-like oxidoreductase (DUF2520 family)